MENKKYILLNESLKALCDDAFSLLSLVGDSGMGKSFGVVKYLKENNIDHVVIKSHVTALEFYKLLHENRNRKIIVFDDLASISDPKIISFLKESCWKILDNDRSVSYHSTSNLMGKLKLPSNFKINANLILISNTYPSEFKPIINRGIIIDFSFTFKEKLEIFKSLVGSPNLNENELDEEVVSFVEKNCSMDTKNLSIRSLVILSRLKKQSFDWKMFATEVLGIEDRKNLIEKLLKKHDKVKDAMEEWCGITGKSESMFYIEKKRLNKI